MSDWTIRGEKPNGETVEQSAESRAEAESMQENASDAGLSDVEVIPPAGGTSETDGGNIADPVDADIVDHTDGGPDGTVMQSMGTDAEQELRNLGGDFTTDIKGTTVINKKGLRVIQHRYDINVRCELQVPPEDTDHEYARAKAVAEMPDGRIGEAHGSAHVDRGDDAFLLTEMADTRAKSRALSDITGIGHVIVEEMAGVEQ